MRGIIAATAFGLLLAGCAGAPPVVRGNDNLLAQSGFNVFGSDTKAFAAAVQQLPPHKFVHHVEQGVLTYYYFDPTICGCLYYGSQQNWDAYKQAMADKRHMQAEQLLIREETPFSGAGG